MKLKSSSMRDALSASISRLLGSLRSHVICKPGPFCNQKPSWHVWYDSDMWILSRFELQDLGTGRSRRAYISLHNRQCAILNLRCHDGTQMRMMAMNNLKGTAAAVDTTQQHYPSTPPINTHQHHPSTPPTKTTHQRHPPTPPCDQLIGLVGHGGQCAQTQSINTK